MRVEIRNRTGLTVVTSATATSGSVSIGDVLVEMDADAWAHTLVCAGPGLRRLVGEGPGMIEVRQVGESPALGIRPELAPSIVLEVSGDPVAISEAVKRELDRINETMDGTNPSPIAPVTTQPRQQGGGKRRR